MLFDLEMNDLVDEMIDAVDDGDGEIDYDEFVKMIQKYWGEDNKYCWVLMLHNMLIGAKISGSNEYTIAFILH